MKVSLRDAMRKGASDEEIFEIIDAAGEEHIILASSSFVINRLE